MTFRTSQRLLLGTALVLLVLALGALTARGAEPYPCYVTVGTTICPEPGTPEEAQAQQLAAEYARFLETADLVEGISSLDPAPGFSTQGDHGCRGDHGCYPTTTKPPTTTEAPSSSTTSTTSSTTTTTTTTTPSTSAPSSTTSTTEPSTTTAPPVETTAPPSPTSTVALTTTEAPATELPSFTVTGDCATRKLTVTMVNPTAEPAWFYVFPTDEPLDDEVPWRVDPYATSFLVWDRPITVTNAATGETATYPVPEPCPVPTTVASVAELGDTLPATGLSRRGFNQATTLALGLLATGLFLAALTARRRA